MVAGISRALEKGRTYSLTELEACLLVGGASLDRLVDSLIDSGRLRPAVITRGAVTSYDEHGMPLAAVSCYPFGDRLRYEAV